MIHILLAAVLAGLLIYAYKAGIKADQKDEVFGGVCSGIAQYTNLTPLLVRVVAVLVALATGGFAILLYIGLWITLPKQ